MQTRHLTCRGLLKTALSISKSRAALEIICGSRSISPRSRGDHLPARISSELRRFIRRAPAAPHLRERYTATETLHGCIRAMFGRSVPHMVGQAFQTGMVLSGDILTPPYIAARTGFATPVQRGGTGRAGPWNGGVVPPAADSLEPDDLQPTRETAAWVMLEASRILRHGPPDDVLPPPELWSYTGIGGDVTDYALVF